jgi:hypothetical protein
MFSTKVFGKVLASLGIVVGVGAAYGRRDVVPPPPGAPREEASLAVQTGPLPSPVLLKRLAEAVDGHRTGVAVYVVASYDAKDPLIRVFEKRTDAEKMVQDSSRTGRRLDVFGPYRAASEPTSALVFFGCQHDGRASFWYPGMCPPEAILKLSEIESMAISVRLRTGQTKSFPLQRTADAIFLSLPGFDKFAVPYYARVLGMDAAMTMRQDIVRRLQQN